MTITERPRHRWRRSALVALSLLAIEWPSSGLALQPNEQTARTASAASESDTSRTMVLVNGREVRALFPPDTSRAWGWPAITDTDSAVLYKWSVAVEGPDGLRSMSLAVRRGDNRARTFTSLKSLVQAGATEICEPGMVAGCAHTLVTASVEGRRVVLSYRRAAGIALMFGARPESITVLRQRPGGRKRSSLERVPVRYAAPPLAVLESALQNERYGQQVYEAKTYSMSRFIAGGADSPDLWLAVGDSAVLGIQEMWCERDACWPDRAPRNARGDWGRWMLSDSSLATLHRAVSPVATFPFRYDPERMMTLVGVKPGRTELRAVGVHTLGDSATLHRPLDSIVTRSVLVTPPISRLEIFPRPATMVTGERRAFVVLALDRSGQPIVGTPVELFWGTRDGHSAALATEPVVVNFDRPGRHEIIGKLGAHADTVRLDVAGPPVPR